jgi:hypothetical protein
LKNIKSRSTIARAISRSENPQLPDRADKSPDKIVTKLNRINICMEGFCSSSTNGAIPAGLMDKNSACSSGLGRLFGNQGSETSATSVEDEI